MLLNKQMLQILEDFSADYHRKLYGRQIAIKHKMNQKTVANILNRLEKEHIVKFSLEGKNKYYYLNLHSPEIREVLKFIEIGKKMQFLSTYKKLQPLFEQLEKRTQGTLVIFGSYAARSATSKSDLDVLVIGKLVDVHDLEDLYSIKINVIRSEKGKFDTTQSLIKEVIKNHIILKGLEEFVELTWQSV